MQFGYQAVRLVFSFLFASLLIQLLQDTEELSPLNRCLKYFSWTTLSANFHYFTGSILCSISATARGSGPRPFGPVHNGTSPTTCSSLIVWRWAQARQEVIITCYYTTAIPITLDHFHFHPYRLKMEHTLSSTGVLRFDAPKKVMSNGP